MPEFVHPATPATLVGLAGSKPERWIEDPKGVDEKTAMPKLGVTRQDATDIAGYLYSTK